MRTASDDDPATTSMIRFSAIAREKRARAVKERTPLLLAAAMVALLGGSVIVGWLFGGRAFLSLHPTFESMKFNTALCFVLLALSLGHAAFLRSRKAIVFASLVALIGVGTLAEYVVGRSFGIDEMFLRDELALGPFPGRMAPNTAIGLILCGAACVRLVWKTRSQMAIAVLGAIISGFGAVPLLGSWGGVVPAFAWGSSTAMAVHTATGFVALGLGLIGVAAVRTAAYQSSRKWFLAPLGIGMATMLFFIWQALNAQERARAATLAETTCESVKGRVTDAFHERIQALVRMAERWEVRGGTPKAEWEAEAAGYARDFPGYTALEWVDSTLRVQWIVPMAGNEAALGAYLGFEDRRFAALSAAMKERRVAMTRVIQLLQGGRGFLLCVPVFRNGEFDGVLLGVFRADSVFAEVIPSEMLSDHALSIIDDNESVYTRGEGQPEVSPGHNASFDVLGVPFQIRVAVTAAALRHSSSHLDDVALIAGFLTAALAIAALYFAETSREHARLLIGHTAALQDRTAELLRSNSELERFAYVASHDLKSPLRAISQLAMWLEEDLEKHFSAANREQMDLLRKRVRRLEVLLDDLLRYSRAGQEAFVAEKVDTSSLVHEVFDSLEKKASFRLATPSPLPNFPTARTPLQHVFSNLIDNALKHHDKSDGEISVSCRDVDRAWYEFIVTDDGPGIPVAYNERVFEPFKTLKSRDVVEGSGIGLAITRKLIESAGGTISLDARAGRGSTFRFSWPKVWPRSERQRGVEAACNQ